MFALASSSLAATSHLSVPVSVSYARLQTVVNENVPVVLAPMDVSQAVAGGVLGTVRFSGQVTRTSHVRVSGQEGSLVMTLPVRVNLEATYGVTRKFGGEASVSVRLTPELHSDYTVTVRAATDLAWTDPLSFELAPGVRVPVTTLVEGVVRTQLDVLARRLETEIARAADLRTRASTAWQALHQPWKLPAPEPAFAKVTVEKLAATPIKTTNDALTMNVQADFDASAWIGGNAPGAVAVPLLPDLVIREVDRTGVQLEVPIQVPYAVLSNAMTAFAARQGYPLAVPLKPTVRVHKVTVTPRGDLLNAATDVTVRALGLRVNATLDVTGRPVLDAKTGALSFTNVTVRTRPTGLTARVLGWLADRRVQDFLIRNALYDTTKDAARLLATVRSKLPFSPVPNVTLTGQVREVDVRSLRVTPSGVVLTGRVEGDVRAIVDPAARLR
ncbi:uncharacterized protein DUF4403 [Deinococcus yavapaiensis KR-236]|uniref:Uncharacterized protein DUF4403 n=2 Tax=Deinococcus TaxID=1298 RepID=A0A318SFZ2_9DEIO|nr:uncharacterized protein DUF4403 [Deinococcus yavapaiensis KR-236]